ncbi:MAG: hypothetical protein HN737_11960 [Desulfobacterales bacterium]|jgi:uncharacterized protein|nr:hypothetical protein [Desulfobacteraceae bacterium]MBT7698111.1 hypothetical protein [Desulfobacterales bacterium]
MLNKPFPRPTSLTQPFWDALNEGIVKIQKCNNCNSWIFYPRSHCTNCLSPDLTWKKINGTGTIYTYSTPEILPTASFFVDELPQKIVVVELDEGPRIPSNMVNVEIKDIWIGMRVKPFLDKVSDDITLLRFEPA